MSVTAFFSAATVISIPLVGGVLGAQTAHETSQPSNLEQPNDEIAKLWKEDDAAFEAKDYVRAEKAARWLVELIGRHAPEGSVDLGKALHRQALYLNELGRNAEAIEAGRNAVRIRTSVLGENHSDTMKSMSNLAVDLVSASRAKEAEPLNRQVLQKRTRILGLKHTNTMLSMSNLAGNLRQLDRYSEAETLDRQALGLRMEVFGASNVATLDSLDSLALDLELLKRYPESEALRRDLLTRNSALLGEKDPATLAALQELARLLNILAKYKEAEPFNRRLFELRSAISGERNTDTASTMISLAANQANQGRLVEAEHLIRRALEVRTRLLTEKHEDTIWSQRILGANLLKQHRAAEAEVISRRAYQLATDSLGEKHETTVLALKELAKVLIELDRSVEAEPMLSKVLAIRTELLGERHADTLESLSDWAKFLSDNGRHREAESLERRVLAIRTADLGDQHSDVTSSKQRLAFILRDLNQHAAATSLLREVLETRIKILGPDHVDFMGDMNNLALSLHDNGESPEAERLSRRALELSIARHGNDSPETGTKRSTLSWILAGAGKLEEAEVLERESSEIRKRIVGSLHPTFLETQWSLALRILEQPSRSHLAVGPARVATAGWRIRRQNVGTSARDEDQLARDAQDQRRFFVALADADWFGAKRAPSDLASLRAEAFDALQETMSGSASQAIALTAARHAVERLGADLGRLVRERQALSDQWRLMDGDRTKALAQGGAEGIPARARVDGQQLAVEARIARIDAQLRNDAPSYFALTRPKPITQVDAQKLLAPNEAALMIVSSYNGTHIMLVTREGLIWTRAAITRKQINEAVAVLRRDLDPPPRDEATTLDGPASFDRQTAHKLYQALIAPVAGALKGKRHLFVAADGALSSLPFGVLVTASPVGDNDDPDALRATSWFSDAHALVQLPSLQSLQFLRSVAAPKPGSTSLAGFAGFGDPVLADNDNTHGKVGQQMAQAAPLAPGRTRDGGTIADVAKLRELPSLPGTAAELENMRAVLGAPSSALRLRTAATERAVRTADLSGSRVIAFATHGLLGGGSGGMAEPGLVFTPPATASDEDDGLLTASEITTLRLNADWVILSACNTAAGNGNGTPGLSGLARAFFYAGARSLLASHWPVRDDVASEITVDAISRQRADPKISRAEALQAAMRSIRNSADDPSRAHPSAWAPFSLIGDAGVQGQ